MTEADPAALLGLAREAASVAGDLLVDHYRRARHEVRAKSTPTDPVTEADVAAERAIRGLLAQRRPDDGVLGEEGGDAKGQSGLRWVVDPLDGTVNFLYGIPQWAVSVACEDARGGLAGVVHDPLRGETFAAARGSSPTLNGEPIQPSGVEVLGSALVATGFAYDGDVRARQGAVAVRVVPRVRDLRRLGSAALDIAWTAAGRYDAYYELGVRHWDSAAGELICATAGLEVDRLPARDGLPAGLLVASPALAPKLRELIEGG